MKLSEFFMIKESLRTDRLEAGIDEIFERARELMEKTGFEFDPERPHGLRIPAKRRNEKRNENEIMELFEIMKDLMAFYKDPSIRKMIDDRLDSLPLYRG